MSTAFKSKLAKLKKLWTKAKAKDPNSFGGSQIEDGIYKARVTACEMTESQSSGRLQVAWGFTIVEGENKGETVRAYDGLESEDNLFYFQRKVARLEKEVPEEIDGVEEVCKEIEKEKPLVKIRVRTKDEFQNVYINKMLTDTGEEVEEEPSESTDAEAEEGAEAEVEEKPAKKGKAEKKEEVAEESEDAEPEAEEEESEEVQLEKGMKVSFKSGGKDVEGIVVEFIDDDTKARVKTDKGVFKVAVENLSVVEGEDEPVEPEAEAEEEAEPEPPKKTATKGKVVKSKK